MRGEDWPIASRRRTGRFSMRDRPDGDRSSGPIAYLPRERPASARFLRQVPSLLRLRGCLPVLTYGPCLGPARRSAVSRLLQRLVLLSGMMLPSTLCPITL